MNMKSSKKNVLMLFLTTAAILAAFSFAWADEIAGRGAAFDNPVIYDQSGNRLYALNRGELMEIGLTTSEQITLSGVTVTKPDGSPDEVLPNLGVKTGRNGYVIAEPGRVPSVVVYFRPALLGTHLLTVYYSDSGNRASTQTFSFQSNGSDGGSGGCGVGVGPLALFAVVGFIAAKKRRTFHI